jgi:hypothetical protein
MKLSDVNKIFEASRQLMNITKDSSTKKIIHKIKSEHRPDLQVIQPNRIPLSEAEDLKRTLVKKVPQGVSGRTKIDEAHASLGTLINNTINTQLERISRLSPTPSQYTLYAIPPGGIANQLNSYLTLKPGAEKSKELRSIMETLRKTPTVTPGESVAEKYSRLMGVTREKMEPLKALRAAVGLRDEKIIKTEIDEARVIESAKKLLRTAYKDTYKMKVLEEFDKAWGKKGEPGFADIARAFGIAEELGGKAELPALVKTTTHGGMADRTAQLLISILASPAAQGRVFQAGAAIKKVLPISGPEMGKRVLVKTASEVLRPVSSPLGSIMSRRKK